MVLVHFDTMASTSAGLQPWPTTVEMGSVGSHPLLVHGPPPQVKFKFGFTTPRGPRVILATFESMLFLCTAATNWPLDKNTSIMPLSKPRCCICCQSAWVSQPAVHLTGGWRFMIDHSMLSFVSCVNFNTHRTQEPWSDARDTNQELCFWWACSQTPAKYNLQIQSSYVTLMWPQTEENEHWIPKWASCSKYW